MKTSFLVLAMLFGNCAFAAPPHVISLCSAGETAIFQCELKGKQLSLCASPDLSATGGTLQYRYGVPAKIELLYPANPEPARERFFLSTTAYSGGGAAHIRFRNGDYEYILFDSTVRTGFGNGPNYPKFSAGVVTKKKGAIVSRRGCTNNASIFSKAYESLPREEFEEIE